MVLRALALTILTVTCPIEVKDPGWHHVILTVHYRHQSELTPGATWSYTTGTWVEGPQTVRVKNVESQPMGYEWVIDMALAGACGEMPELNTIFEDGLETGDTAQWDKTGGAE